MLSVELFAATHAIKSLSMLNGCLGNIELPLFFIENVSYFFSPWQSSSKLDSAHGLSKKFQIFIAVHNFLFKVQ